MKMSRCPLILPVAIIALGCIENTSYVTRERSDKVAGYLLKKVPKIQHAKKIDLEGKVEFLGYDLKADNPKPGSKVEVTWYWQVKRPPGPGWRLFTHGIGGGEAKLNKDTAGPIRGSFQPEHWKAGMIIKDPQSFKIPDNWASETLELRTGIWKGAARLKGKTGMDRDNRIKGPKLKVQLKPQAPPVDIPYAAAAPVIDGKFENEAAWKSAVSLKAFVNTIKGTPFRQKTDVKLMWDDKNLYVAFTAQDKNLKTQYTKHDDELWHDDAFEIFLDPKGDKKDYYELQVSPKGVIFDAYLPKYRKNQNDWSSNMKAAVAVDGTINDESDTDTGWSGEIAVPFESMKKGGGVPPAPGDIWTANFFRIDTGGKKKEYSAWSAPMRGDFHTLGKFGRISFVKKQDEAAADKTEKAAASKASAGKASKKNEKKPSSVKSKPKK
jgi:hypothetical protein